MIRLFYYPYRSFLIFIGPIYSTTFRTLFQSIFDFFYSFFCSVCYVPNTSCIDSISIPQNLSLSSHKLYFVTYVTVIFNFQFRYLFTDSVELPTVLFSSCHYHFSFQFPLSTTCINVKNYIILFQFVKTECFIFFRFFFSFRFGFDRDSFKPTSCYHKIAFNRIRISLAFIYAVFNALHTPGSNTISILKTLPRVNTLDDFFLS